MFSVVDAVLLRPLPFPHPEQIVSVYATDPTYRANPTHDVVSDRGRLSVPELQALIDERPDQIIGVGGYSLQERVVFPEGAAAYKIRLGLTTPSLLSRVLQVQPVTGRLFTEEEATSGEAVALVSESHWERAYSRDPGIVGRELRLDTGVVEIIGVIPQLHNILGAEMDVWIPLRMRTGIGNHFLPVLARLASGVSVNGASASMKEVLDGILPAGHEEHDIRLLQHHREQTRDIRRPLLLLWAAAGLLLLVACASSTAVTVADGINRRGEFGIRCALGAGRRQLLAQLFGEGIVQSVIAAVIGLALAGFGTRALLLVAPYSAYRVPRLSEANMDPRALTFGVAVALIVAVVTNMIPALRALRAPALTAGPSVRNRRSRLEGALVVAEVSLAIVLLAGAGLLARTVLALTAVDTGMAHESLLAVRVDPQEQFLRRAVPPEDTAAGINGLRNTFYRTLADEIEALPGVRGAALTRVVPLHPYRENNEVEPQKADVDSLRAERRIVSGNYFEVTGIRIVDGRPLDAADDRFGAPGRAVVSAGLAAVAWPGQSAVGKRLRYFGGDLTVVGVAANVRDETVEASTRFAFYVAGHQAAQVMPWILVRTGIPPERVVASVREHVHGLGAGVVIDELAPVSDYLRTEIAEQLYRARLVMLFSAAALLLALAGVFGVSARHVGSRKHEIGVRKALGARNARIVASVVGRAVGLAAIGAFLGLVAVLLMGRFIDAFLWGVEPHDPATLLAVLGVTLITAVLAAAVPARRTLEVDPARALRAE